MRNSALQERRNRQILADIVRAYIETGEPVSSRAISKGFEEALSTATIRNVMADLEEGGFLYQPHTSAGHVLAEVSNGLGIIVSPPLGKTVLEHTRMWLLPDGRVVVVLISPGGNTR